LIDFVNFVECGRSFINMPIITLLNISPWMVGFDCNGHSHLCTMAKHILLQVCLTLWCEQNWSSYSFVHSKVQNCLRFDQAIDPMYIYTNSKLLEEWLGATPISWYEKNMLDDVLELQDATRMNSQVKV
jgi:hypothetical protein